MTVQILFLYCLDISRELVIIFLKHANCNLMCWAGLAPELKLRNIVCKETYKKGTHINFSDLGQMSLEVKSLVFDFFVKKVNA